MCVAAAAHEILPIRNARLARPMSTVSLGGIRIGDCQTTTTFEVFVVRMDHRP